MDDKISSEQEMDKRGKILDRSLAEKRFMDEDDKNIDED
jgi:hypothetical protein